MIGLIILAVIVILTLCLSIRTVRPVERGLVERMGKYVRFGRPGLVLILPLFEKLHKINITEMMVDAGTQEIITKDSLNAQVDAQVYFKVEQDEESVKASEYNVYNYKIQIVALARTTLRNIIGTMTLTEANSERGKINALLFEQLTKETKAWGISIVRTELKEINPPKDVQDVMNRVVIAEKEKTAAVDFATAVETKADGERRAIIKVAEGQRQSAILQAEGQKQAKVLVADGEAQAIKLVNEAAQTYFKGDAKELRQLQAVEQSLSNSSKIVIPEGKSLVNVIGDLADLTQKK